MFLHLSLSDTFEIRHIQDLFKKYAYVTFDCVYVWPPNVRHTFRVPGTRFPRDKIQERGWNIATTLIVAFSLVRTSAKQMSHRSRSVDAYRRASLAKIVSLGWNKSYFPLDYLTRTMWKMWEISICLINIRASYFAPKNLKYAIYISQNYCVIFLY